MSEAALTSNQSFTLEDLKNLTDSDMLRVNQVITENLASHVALINQLSQHIIFKRWQTPAPDAGYSLRESLQVLG